VNEEALAYWGLLRQKQTNEQFLHRSAKTQKSIISQMLIYTKY
jgi:hypothetical protein